MPLEPPDATADILAQLGRGEVAATEALVRAYTPYLRAIVRRQLADRLWPKFDSADVVQSVWVQVVQHLRRDGWRVGSEGELRALLATIARRRLVTRVRRSDARAEERPAAGGFDELPETRVVRPSEVVQAEDLWGQMLRICPPDHHAVLTLRREGLLLHEIAARTGLHEGSVRRILRQLARKLALDREPLGPGEAGAAEGRPSRSVRGRRPWSSGPPPTWPPGGPAAAGRGPRSTSTATRCCGICRAWPSN